MPSTPDLIGSAEASRILAVSLRTVHRLVDAGTLSPALTAPGGPHGAHLFKREDVEELAKARVA